MTKNLSRRRHHRQSPLMNVRWIQTKKTNPNNGCRKINNRLWSTGTTIWTIRLIRVEDHRAAFGYLP